MTNEEITAKTMTALRQATVWLEAGAAWQEKHPDEDIETFLKSRSTSSRNAVVELTALIEAARDE